MLLYLVITVSFLLDARCDLTLPLSRGGASAQLAGQVSVADQGSGADQVSGAGSAGAPDRAVVLGLLLGVYATTGLAVAGGALPWPVLLVALGLPLLAPVAGARRRPRPERAALPDEAASTCRAHLRLAGALLVVGLAVAAASGTGLPVG